MKNILMMIGHSAALAMLLWLSLMLIGLTQAVRVCIHEQNIYILWAEISLAVVAVITTFMAMVGKVRAIGKDD